MTSAGMRKAGALLALVITTASPRKEALANGAFPDSMGILLPSDHPSLIIAATNFGLLISEDDGVSWGWVCEEAVAVNSLPGNIVSLYELGAPPNDLLLAVSFTGVSYSSNFGCTWDLAEGEIGQPGFYMYDISPHAVDPLRSYALARHGDFRTAHESRDGARSYGPALSTSALPDILTGIENARSRPETLYATVYRQGAGPPIRPFMWRSYDSGEHWQPPFDPGPDFDNFRNALIAVDPVDEKRVYLRMADARHPPREALAIYDDDPEHGTGTMRRVLEYPMIPGAISAFLRRSDGALIVGTSGNAFISTDQGGTFEPWWPNAPHLRGLGERNGVLYAVADNVSDGYAVGRSTNGGQTWEHLIRFQELTGPKNCGNLASICAGPWETLRGRLGIPDRGTDGGADAGSDAGTDAGVDAGSDAGNPTEGDAGSDGGGNSVSRSKSSGCSEGASPDVAPWSVLAIILAVAAIRRIQRRFGA